METEKASADPSCPEPITTQPASDTPAAATPTIVPDAAQFETVQAAIDAIKDAQAAMPEHPAVVAAASSVSSPEKVEANGSADTPAPASQTRPAEPARVARLNPRPVVPVPGSQRAPGGAEPRSANRTGRFALLAASIAVAAGIGAAAGAAGFAGISRLTNPATTPQVRSAATAEEVKSLRDSVAQLRASTKTIADSVGALRGQIEGAGKGTQTQLARLGEAVERVERAQAEPAARLARVTEAVDRLEKRNAGATPEVTGAIKPPPLPPIRPETRTNAAVLDAWSLRRVYQGVALIEGRFGQMEVEVGDDIRGAGRVQNIKRQDGRWVVVTNRGLILQR
jgi:hypothetical protein